MSVPFRVYNKTLKLPCVGLADGRPFQSQIDHGLRSIVAACSSYVPQPEIKMRDEDGHFAATLRTKAWRIEIETKFGQNSIYAGGVRRTFISYQIRMESQMSALDRAAAAGDRMTLLAKIIGGVLSPFLFFWLMSAILDKLGFVIIPHYLVAISVVVGVWGGAKLGGK